MNIKILRSWTFGNFASAVLFSCLNTFKGCSDSMLNRVRTILYEVLTPVVCKIMSSLKGFGNPGACSGRSFWTICMWHLC